MTLPHPSQRINEYRVAYWKENVNTQKCVLENEFSTGSLIWIDQQLNKKNELCKGTQMHPLLYPLSHLKLEKGKGEK